MAVEENTKRKSSNKPTTRSSSKSQAKVTKGDHVPNTNIHVERQKRKAAKRDVCLKNVERSSKARAYILSIQVRQMERCLEKLRKDQDKTLKMLEVANNELTLLAPSAQSTQSTQPMTEELLAATETN